MPIRKEPRYITKMWYEYRGDVKDLHILFEDGEKRIVQNVETSEENGFDIVTPNVTEE